MHGISGKYLKRRKVTVIRVHHSTYISYDDYYVTALHCEVQVWGRIYIVFPPALHISCISWSLLDSGLFFNNIRISKAVLESSKTARANWGRVCSVEGCPTVLLVQCCPSYCSVASTQILWWCCLSLSSFCLCLMFGCL